MRSRAEWMALVGGLIGNLIVLVYCGWYIAVAKQWQTNHTAYTIARDDKWEPILVETEAHLKRQDKDSADLKKQVLAALQNQSVLNKNQVDMTRNQAEMTRNQAEILKNQIEILERMKAKP